MTIYSLVGRRDACPYSSLVLTYPMQRARIRAVVEPGIVRKMKKSIVCSAVVIAAVMGIGTYYSVSRVATCEGQNRVSAACIAQSWDMEKVNVIPQYDPNHYVSDPTADSIFAASVPKR